MAATFFPAGLMDKFWGYVTIRMAKKIVQPSK
jgi:hypothetical protein